MSQESLNKWQSKFKEIYSSIPYQNSLIDNADNFLQFWQISWEYYHSEAFVNPYTVVNLILTLIYILISILNHILILIFALPISAIFLSSDQPMWTTLEEWINESAIAIQSICFSLLDLIAQPLIFCLSLLLKPLTIFENLNPEPLNVVVPSY